MPDFGVVVVNWNGAADTIACLESLAAARPGPLHVTVVDNGSTDRSIEIILRWIRGHEPLNVFLDIAHENRGFAGGNNQGLADLERDTRVTHFLLLNNDATVAPDFFAVMARAIADEPDAGLLGATIYEADDSGRVWYAGGVIQPLRARTRHHTALPPDGAARPTGFVTGCALMIARHALEALGPLADCYFPLYMEDVEYSYRAHAAGLKVRYVPQAVVHHRRGGTVGRYDTSANVVLWQTRHEGYFIRRNLRGPRKLAALGAFALLKARGVAGALCRGDARRVPALLRGVWQGLLRPCN
jgi:GT2 family glycosyltransferase